MQKSTNAQLDDKVNEKVDQTVPRAVREILNEDLNTKAFKKSKRRKSLNTSSTDGMIIQQSAASENVISNVASMQPSAPIVPSIPQPVSAPNTFVDASGNQFLMVPVGQFPQLLQRAPTNEQANYSAGSRGGRNFRGGRGFCGRFNRSSTKHSGIFDAYCMDSAPLNIFENQVNPTGLHDISKSFRPNLATTRVFSMGTKFIPVWKKTKIYKPFSKFQDFCRRMTNKMFFEETTPGVFVRNKIFGINAIGGLLNITEKLTNSALKYGME